jgi:2-oxoglutarate dehydrogenase E2 component (dihydrolipoamide succinyltransferase)
MAQSLLEVKIPAVGESIAEVTISAWLKKDGDVVAMDEVLGELESDKATFELSAEGPGVLRLKVAEGETVPIGALVATIEAGGEGAGANGAAPKAEAAAAPAATTSEATKDEPVAAASNGAATATTYASGTPSPAAGKILDEKGIAPADVAGTGRDGRITKEDAQNASAQATTAAAAPTAAPAPAKPASVAGERGEHREKMSPLRRTVAKRLVAVKNETAMLTTFNEVDMKPIMDLRGKYKDKFKEKHGVGLGFMSFFTKAVCLALKDFPAVNAQISGDEILYHDYVDVSIAVSAPKGLMVPVIRDVDQMSLADIEKAVIEMAGKARDSKLTLEEMTGGTFTITNGGVFGSMLSTPIINAPQSAILGMHNIVERAVVKNGEIVIRPIMYVALSYDHRIIDGKESVSFLVRVKEYLEDPARMLLGL